VLGVKVVDYSKAVLPLLAVEIGVLILFPPIRSDPASLGLQARPVAR